MYLYVRCGGGPGLTTAAVCELPLYLHICCPPGPTHAAEMFRPWARVRSPHPPTGFDGGFSMELHAACSRSAQHVQSTRL